MDVCSGCGATLGPQEQFCGACGRFRTDATTRVWPPQDATSPQNWPPPQDGPPVGAPATPAPAYGGQAPYGGPPQYGGPAQYGYTQPVPGYYYGGVAPA